LRAIALDAVVDATVTRPPSSQHRPVTSHAFHRRFLESTDTGERTFPQHYLLYASEGTFRLETDTRSWLLPSHRAALVRADTPIRVCIAAPATSASVLFDVSTMAAPPAACSVFRVSPLVREMVLHAARWDEAAAREAVAAAPFFLALSHVVAEAAGEPEALWFPRPTSGDLRRALDFTLLSLKEHVSIADVALAAKTSERTLNRRFADELSMTWTEFMQRARIVYATEQVISTHRNLASIAYDFGFSSASKFSRAFKHIHGETPASYRKRHGT
jgi:AraC-like DNA-binding protein